MNDTISLIKSRILGLMKDVDKLGAEVTADVKQAVSPLFEAIKGDDENG